MKMLLCFLLFSALTKEIVSNDQSSASSEMLTKDPLETSVDNIPVGIGKRQVKQPTLVEGVSTGNQPVIEPTELEQTNKEEATVLTTVTRMDMKETSSSEEVTTTVAALKPESNSTLEEEALKLQKSEFEKTRQEKRSMTDDGIKTRTGTTLDVQQQIPGTKEATTTDESIGQVNKTTTSVSSSTEEIPTPQ